MKPTAPWHRSREEIIQLLTLRMVMAARAGRPCPVAARVVERLEQLGGQL